MDHDARCHVPGVRFPIQGEDFPIDLGNVTDPSRRPHCKIEPGWIPWVVARAAYKVYCAHGHGSQTLDQLAQRGGFGWLELIALLSGDFGHGGLDRASRCLRQAAYDLDQARRSGES